MLTDPLFENLADLARTQKKNSDVKKREGGEHQVNRIAAHKKPDRQWRQNQYDIRIRHFAVDRQCDRTASRHTDHDQGQQKFLRQMPLRIEKECRERPQQHHQNDFDSETLVSFPERTVRAVTAPFHRIVDPLECQEHDSRVPAGYQYMIDIGPQEYYQRRCDHNRHTHRRWDFGTQCHQNLFTQKLVQYIRRIFFHIQ